jgi:CheY-like chemotaxis protein
MKILAVSGVPDKEYHLRAAEMLGADATLKKPITRESLLETLSRLAQS